MTPRLFWSIACSFAIVAAHNVVTLVAATDVERVQRARARAPEQRSGFADYSRADSELIARRLHRGVLGREADAGGLSVATAEIQRGNLLSVVNGMVASAEFRTNQRRRRPAQLLDQLFQGIFERAPDSAAVRAYLPRLEAQEYTAVVAELIGSPEFRAALGASPAADKPLGRIETALNCQTRILDAASRDAGGRIFLTFDRMPTIGADRDGQTVEGPAVDRFNDLDRALTYRCDGRAATYAYADRRPPAAADPRLEYPSAAVRNCQEAVRAGLVFASAALSAADNGVEYVLGLSGRTSHQCHMNGARVVSVK